MDGGMDGQECTHRDTEERIEIYRVVYEESNIHSTVSLYEV